MLLLPFPRPVVVRLLLLLWEILPSFGDRGHDYSAFHVRVLRSDLRSQLGRKHDVCTRGTLGNVLILPKRLVSHLDVVLKKIEFKVLVNLRLLVLFECLPVCLQVLLHRHVQLGFLVCGNALPSLAQLLGDLGGVRGPEFLDNALPLLGTPSEERSEWPLWRIGVLGPEETLGPLVGVLEDPLVDGGGSGGTLGS